MPTTTITVDDATLEAMNAYGGSFVRTLARLYRVGDSINQARLRAAFPEYFSEYARLAHREIT